MRALEISGVSSRRWEGRDTIGRPVFQVTGAERPEADRAERQRPAGQSGGRSRKPMRRKAIMLHALRAEYLKTHKKNSGGLFGTFGSSRRCAS